MIKKFIDKLLGKGSGKASPADPFGKREDVPATVHGIDPSLDLTHQLQHMAREYAGGRPLSDPEISPLFAPVDGFPPTIITTCIRVCMNANPSEGFHDFLLGVHNKHSPWATLLAH